jgi:hypothetical protein
LNGQNIWLTLRLKLKTEKILKDFFSELKKVICCFAMFRIIKYHSLFALDRVALEKERLIFVVAVAVVVLLFQL